MFCHKMQIITKVLIKRNKMGKNIKGGKDVKSGH